MKVTFKESIRPKRLAHKPEGASQLPTKGTRSEAGTSTERWRSSQHSSARGRPAAQQPPDDSHSWQIDSPSPAHPMKGVGQANIMSNYTTSPENPFVCQQADSRQLPEPARGIIEALENMVEVMEAYYRKLASEILKANCSLYKP